MQYLNSKIIPVFSVKDVSFCMCKKFKLFLIFYIYYGFDAESSTYCDIMIIVALGLLGGTHVYFIKLSIFMGKIV